MTSKNTLSKIELRDIRQCIALPLVSSLLLLLLSGGVSAMDKSKPKNTIQLKDTTLHLNGAGVRSKFLIDLYQAALYLKTPTTDAQAIIDADEIMLLQIRVISNLISSENLTRGTREGFDKSTNNQPEAIQGQIDAFLLAFKEPISTGDTFEIVYQPKKGVTVIKNRKVSKRLPNFKQALFGIWLSNKPAQKSLKDQLLGK